MQRILGTSVAVLLGLAMMAGAVQAEDKTADVSLDNEINQYLEQAGPKWDDPKTLRAYWKSGLNLASGDGNFKLKVGGRIMWDNYWASSDDYGGDQTADTTFFRRLRFYMSGSIHKNTIYKLQVDFASAAQDEGSSGEVETTGKLVVSLKDAFIGWKNLPGGITLLVGHFKEFFSLEEMTSSKYITFMERGAPVQAFAPSRNPGWAINGNAVEKRLYWGIGIFKSANDDSISDVDGNYSFTLRVTGLAVKTEEHLLHIGVSATFRGDDVVRYRSRWGPGRGSRLVDTGRLNVKDAYTVDIEAVWVWKSLSVQVEYFFNSNKDADGESYGDPSFGGWYVYVSYFITGETRPYKDTTATMSRVKPKNNFWDGEGGPGAWEVAFRVDSVDFTDGTVTGGEQMTYTVGVNWYQNANTRVMFNYVFAQQDPNEDGAKTDISAFMIRWQIDF
jgi:phosphate-selective porin OprO/OprP